MKKFIKDFLAEWVEFFMIQSEITVARTRLTEWM